MHSVERELKYEVDESFVVPELDVPDGGRVENGTQSLDSVYFDTDRRDLLANGVTLRYRRGSGDAGWQVTLPNGQPRAEVRVGSRGSDTAVPAELADLLVGVRRGRSLRHAVTVCTERRTRRLLTGAGPVVEIADDRVRAVRPGGGSAVVVTRWREIEAELGPAGSDKVLAAVDARLTEAGATRSEVSNKVTRALGTTVDPAGKRPKLRTAGEVITAYLVEQDRALVAGDLSLRRGLGGVHPTRVATRRLRSTLRIFADYLDPERAAAFDDELSWYAELLGQVRDREVQRARFAAALDRLPDELVLGPVAAGIEQTLLGEQLRHEQALRTTLDGPRYLTLLTESQRWATHPPLTGNAAGKTAALLKSVTSAERKVRKHLAAGLGDGGDEELHKARKAGKRARYAIELAAPLLGRKANKRIKRYKKLQDILGDHQDGVVAAALLRRLAAASAGNPQENGFTYGLLFAQEQQRAEHSRRLVRSWSP